MDSHRAERMTEAEYEDLKAANKNWSAAPKPGLPKYNVPWTCSQREIGNVPRRRGASGPPQDLQWAAEDELIVKNHEEHQCQLPTTSRSTFLMVFSPDGTKVASTHGDHNVYVSDLPSGKGIRKLSGHPRTPWCLAFHPSSNQILASGCLGGQVRVWDLHGGSELWTAESHTVIASLAFHPTDRMLVVATYNELHFWDWSQPVPFAKCFTASEKEKVRYVTFDPLGHKLITGIANRTFVQSQWDRIPVSMAGSAASPSSSAVTYAPMNHHIHSMPSTSSGATSSSPSSSSAAAATTTSSTSTTRPQASSPPPSSQSASRGASNSSSSSALPSSEQENRVTVCFRSLMEQYEQLVQRYYDLSRAQVVAGSSRDSGRYVVPGTSGASSSAPTTDRGTDPMEQESAAPGSSGQGPSSSQSDHAQSADSSLSGLDSLRANLRRFRQPNFIHLPGCTQRGRVGVTRITSQSTSEAGRSGESRGEANGSSPAPTREGASRGATSGTSGDFLMRMMHLPNTSRICRVRGLSASFNPSTSSTTTPPSSSSTETPSPSVPSSGSRPFASVRSAFRPRLNTLRPPEQAALDLRVRSCHATTETTFSTSTFSTSLRSAFQPRTSSSRAGGVATRGSSSGRQGSRFSLPPADVSVRFGIQLLSRHIDNMQRLCRARLEILQLQQIRRMWEDLQRQIGSLHAAVRDSSSTPGPSPSPNASTNSPRPSPPHSPPPSNSPPPRPSRPSRPTLLPPSPPPIPPPPLSSPSSGEDEGVEPSPDPRAEDEEDGLRVRELMELARISGGEEPDVPSAGSAADGLSEGGGDAGVGVALGATASPFRDRPGNQTSRKRARVPSRFPEPGPSRRPRTSWHPEAEVTGENVTESESSGASVDQISELVPPASVQGESTSEEPAVERRDDGDANEAGEEVAGRNLEPAPASGAAAASESSSSSGPTPSQISSFRQAGEDFHDRFCSMISRLELLVRQQRENRESYGRARGDALWSRREAGRPEGGSRGSSDSGRSSADGPVFTLSDSSSDESDSSNVASPLARRMQVMKRRCIRRRHFADLYLTYGLCRHLRACQRVGWRRRGVADGEEQPPCPPRATPAPEASPPPSTSSQAPAMPSSSSSSRDEPGTSGGTPSDAEWQWTRESTRLRARQVLSMMVESLTQFFEQHGLSHETPHAILDEQIYNLYVLLQLALELTDLLLIQLMSTRRELEEQWVSSLRGTNSEGGGSNAQDSTSGRSGPSAPSPSSANPHRQRLIGAITRSIFPNNCGDSEGSQRPSEGRDSGSLGMQEVRVRPRRFFTVPEVQVNDVPVAPEAVSLLGEPQGGRPRARSPPPPVNIFVPVGGPRNLPMNPHISSTPTSRRGRPNPFVQLHQLRRLGQASGGLGGSGTVGNGASGNGAGGAVGGEGRFRRFLHPRYVGPNPLGDEYREDPLQETVENILRDATMAVTHRIQAWDFSSCTIPEIGDGEQNVVVPECKIHNDASVDVSSDGRMLVALLPPGRLQINTMLGIYSLEWGNLGDCLFIMSLAQNAVSVSLSPTCRHLAVGLASRRVALLPSDRHTMAQLYRLESAPPYPSPPPSSLSSSKGKGTGKGLRRGGNGNQGSAPNSSQVIGHLHHIRDIEQGRGQGHASLNCIRWMPVAGQGLVFGTSTGHLKVLR
ncbi:serine-rich adhesin for platelets-like isoform X2 [Ischnura elegans]|uniref:serine-rich adhesin for platelets-like isoform X2 n=1 Tax=Ischnura elegans TaxID=197161 RepID=UPI001ED88308|nr:serine-rich adhesin for platelets-like isoform X2 [Ischnura elegans]